ncbi:Exopolygalacturonase clone GBGE184 [Glycine soja]|nr:hypothetical protein JHK87_026529 [Glycine soja]RZB85213.1 Exopolygalacturonase clone GBGE184 [Glycine soja]
MAAATSQNNSTGKQSGHRRHAHKHKRQDQGFQLRHWNRRQPGTAPQACTLTYISIGYSTTDIAITNITCAHSHGVSIGSLGKWPEERSVNGISVTNCTFLNTTNGARIKTWMGTVPAEAKNIAYEGLIMKGVQNPIVIDQSYGFKKKSVSLQCSTSNPCEGVEIADVDLAYAGRPHNTSFVSSCSNAKTIFGGILNPPAC